MEFEAEGAHHKFIFVDEAGFNLCKVRRRGRNIIGLRANVTVPGQRGANITMCAAISNDGVLCHIPTIGLYNTERLITFLDALKEILIPPEERGLLRPGMSLYVIIWDNVAFHHSRLEWMVCSTASYYDAIPPCILAFSKPNRGVLLCLEVEGVWSPAIWADAPPGGNECWLPGNRCRGLPGMDTPCKEVFPSVHCKGKHSMRCWWEPVA